MNPFRNRTHPLPWSTVARLCVCGVVLVPVRLSVLIVSILCVWPLCFLATVGLGDAALRRPLAPWRRAIRAPLFAIMRVILWCLGFWPGCITVRGARVDKAAAGAVVYNHVTFSEPILLEYLTGGVPVSAAENSRYPLLGALIRALQTIPVDARDKVDAAVAAQRHSAGDAMAAVARNPALPQLLVAPEGMTTNGCVVAAFKLGAFAPMVPVQPVAVAHRYSAFDPSWLTDGPNNYLILLMMMASPYSRVDVRFLPVEAPTADEVAAAAAGGGGGASAAAHAAAAAFAGRVAASIAGTLGVPASRYSQHDQALVHAAARLYRYASPSVLVPPGGLAALGVSRDEALDALAAFAARDVARTGRIAAVTPATAAALVARAAGSRVAPEGVDAPTPLAQGAGILRGRRASLEGAGDDDEAPASPASASFGGFLLAVRAGAASRSGP